MSHTPTDTWRVPFDGSFDLPSAPTAPPEGHGDKKANKKRLAKDVRRIAALQRTLYADNQRALLLVFQAMDAAGKDSTIRAVMSGVNPAGCQVFSFKSPSPEELDHDFLWRSAVRLPERGRIGIFNRSYYEETLVVRVHPEYLDGQCLPDRPALDELWEQRFSSIRDHEQHLARNGTHIIKFWLNVSRDEQRRRFLARLDTPEKRWKFSAGDLRERARWNDYMDAYQATLNATSRPWAPWYAIPADDKPFMRATVGRIVRAALEGMNLAFPQVEPEHQARLDELRGQLRGEGDDEGQPSAGET